jgi:imidazolonepropionase-like amidohydrolase
VHMGQVLPPSDTDPTGRTFFAPLFLASGITGVRSMFDSLGMVQKLRADVRAGSPGPRIVTAGPILDGPTSYWPGSIKCANPEQGRNAVQKVKSEGADFVKVYNDLDVPTYLAIASEAKALGLPFAGHVPWQVTAAQASGAGQKSFEHLYGIFLSCSSNENELRDEMRRTGARRTLIEAIASRTYDPEKAAALFETFKSNGTWQTPTLVYHRASAFIGDADFPDDPRVKFLGGDIRKAWDSAKPGFREWSAAERHQYFERQLSLVGSMHRAGVKILAGTDTANPFVYPGTSLHDELSLLVRAGLTPIEALQAATIRAAEYLGLADQLGSIVPGKLADLVLLDHDPLTDIQNTRSIAAVVKDGKMYSRIELSQIRAAAEDAR